MAENVNNIKQIALDTMDKTTKHNDDWMSLKKFA